MLHVALSNVLLNTKLPKTKKKKKKKKKKKTPENTNILNSRLLSVFYLFEIANVCLSLCLTFHLTLLSHGRALPGFIGLQRKEASTKERGTYRI